MPVSLPDALLNFTSLWTALKNRTPGFLGGLDAAAQSAATITSAAAAGFSNPWLASVSIMASGVAFETGTAVLVSDYTVGKFNSQRGRFQFIADAATVLGDIATFVGGCATLTPGPGGKLAGQATQVGGDFLTVSGLLAQAAANSTDPIPTQLAKDLISNISTLIVGASSLAAALRASQNPQSGAWTSMQATLSDFLGPIQNAIAAPPDGATFLDNVVATVNAISSFDTAILSAFNSIVVGNSALTNTDTQQQNYALSTWASASLQFGYYLTLAGDDASSIASAVGAAEDPLKTVDAATLTRINAVFGVDLNALTSGSLVHVPVQPKTPSDFATGTVMAINETYVFDPSSFGNIPGSGLYTVGSSPDGHDAGALIIDTPMEGGGFATFDAGTWSGVSLEPNGTIDVTLIAPTLGGSSVPLGMLNFAPTTGAGTFTLSGQGLFGPPGIGPFGGPPVQINVPGGSTFHVSDPVATPEQILLGYLAQLGVSDTAPILDQINNEFNDPALGISLNVTTEDFGNGSQIAFDKGTVAGLYNNGATIGGTLTDTNGDALASLSLDANTGIGTLIIGTNDPSLSSFNNLTFSISGAGVDVTNPGEGVTPIQALLDYLALLGDSASSTVLAQMNFNASNPLIAGAVSSTIVKTSDTTADVHYTLSGDGLSIAGEPTAPITDYVQGVDAYGNSILVPSPFDAQTTNYLDTGGDISRDGISGISTLNVEGDVTLTIAQFGQFDKITGTGTITAADGGTFDLNASNIDQTAQFTGLAATDWSGTTLIGNDINGQTLTASRYGNDALIAGNGTGDMLVAGEGVDMLIGGAGSDTFVLNDLPAPGTIIQGGTGVSTLVANGDISQLNINGIGTLRTNDITLTAPQLNAFSAIEADSDFNGIASGTIYAFGPGTFSIEGKSSDQYNMTATDWGGTTLIGNDADYETLTASLFGADTLHSGDGTGDKLVAGDGNDKLIAGNGLGDTLIAGGGVDTLIGGTGGDTFSAQNILTSAGLASGSVIQGNGSNNVLQASGDISGASISGIQTLQINGNITLTADQLSEFNAVQGGGAVTAATGGVYDLSAAMSGPLDFAFFSMAALSDQDTTLISNDVDGETLTVSPNGNDTLIGNGAWNYLDASHSNGNNQLITLNPTNQYNSGIEAINYLDAYASTGNNVLTAGDRDRNTLDASYSDGDNTLIVGNGIANGLSVAYSSGDNTLIAGDGSDGLDAEYSFGDNKLTAGNGVRDSLSADYSFGDNVLAAGNGDNDLLDVSYSSGNNTLTVGSGHNDMLNATGATGDNTFFAEGGSDTFYGGEGNNTYVFSGDSTGSDLIINDDTGANHSVIEFTAGVAPSQVTLAQSGNDLVLIIGVDPITVQNYFGSTSSQIDAIEFADGTVLDQNTILSQIPLVVNGTISLTAAQFNQYSVIEGSGTILGTTAGTYDLQGKCTTAINLTAEASGGTTLIGNDADGEILTASASGNDTLIAGNGNGDQLVAGSGADSLQGGAGNDTFVVQGPVAAGTTITGGSGANVLQASGDISNATVSGIGTLDDVNGGVSLTAAEFAEFGTFEAESNGFIELFGTTGGTYSLTGKTVIGDTNGIFLYTDTSDDTELIGGNGLDTEYLAALGTGTNTIIAGLGNDFLEGGGGTNTLIGGSGTNTYEIAPFSGPTTIVNGTGTNILDAGGDVTGDTFSNIPTLQLAGPVTMTLGQFSEFTTISALADFPGSLPSAITAGTGGTWSLAGKTSDEIDMIAGSSSGTTLIGDDAGGETLTASASGDDTLIGGNGDNDVLNAGTSGNDTLTAGNGAGDSLNAGSSTGNIMMTGGNGGDTFIGGLGDDTMIGGSGNDIFDAGPGNDYMQGNGGHNTYFFGSDDTGTYVIDNYHTDTHQSVLRFGAGIAASQVEMAASGNDLALTISNESITVQNFFAGADYQLSAIQFADGTLWSSSYVLSAVLGPTLTPVSNQVDEATGPDGAPATFGVTASDPVDGRDPVTFEEDGTIVHSGDTFSLGVHTITASATNSEGTTSSEQFTVTITAPAPSGPTVTSVVATGTGITDGTGGLNAGSVVTLTVNLSAAVAVVGGTPTLTLNDNGAATYDAAKSTPTALAFDYTVAAGQDTANLAVTQINLNGASITESIPVTVTGGSGLSLTDGQGHVWAFGPADSYGYAILRNGAQYANGSGETLALDTNGVIWTQNNLNNWYMVGPTGWAFQSTGPTLAPSGGGQVAGLTGAVTTFTGLQIDTTVPPAPTGPVVTSAVATGTGITNGTGDLHAGSIVTLTVDLSATVAVMDGTPTLTLNDNATAAYDAAKSTPTALAFDYTVAVGQDTANLAVTGVNLNGAAVTNSIPVTVTGGGGQLTDGQGHVWSFGAADSYGNAILRDGVQYANGSGETLALDTNGVIWTQNNLNNWYMVVPSGWTGESTGPPLAPGGGGQVADLSGALTTFTGLQIDTTVPPAPTGPAVTSVVATGAGITAGAGDLNAGAVVTLTVNLSAAVAVVGGTPTLTLNDNGAATYDAAKSTPTALAFDYTVAAGQDTANLAVTQINLNGASITESIPVTVTGGSGLSLTDGQGHVWAFGPADSYGYAILRNGAQYANGSGETLALDTNGVIWTQNNLNNWYMVGPTGWAFQSTGPTLAPSGGGQVAGLTGAVTTFTGLQIDTTVPPAPTGPVVTSVVATGTGITNGTGDLHAGSIVTLTVDLSATVAVMDGTPTLSLNDNGTATYDAAKSTPTALAFDYTVAAGQDTANLAVTAVNLNGATVTNSVPVTAAGGSGLSLTDGQGHVWAFGPADSYGYAILRNGVQYANGSGETLALDTNGVIWTQNNLNNWYMVGPTGWAFQSTGPTLAPGGGGQAADLTGAVTTLTGLQIDTTATWAAGVSGTWQTAADWSPVTVPDSGYSASITAPGTYTVTDPQTTRVYSVATAAGASLDITGGTFTTNAGPGAAGTITNAGTLSANGANLVIMGDVNNTGNLDANNGNITIQGVVTGGTATIEGTGQIEFGTSSAANITFAANAAGTVQIDQTFAGTVAGMAAGDSFDLANFQFSNNPTIAGVTGNGNAGTTTNVTLNDGSENMTLELLNQYANQFAVDASAYSLTADNSSSPNHGTLFQVAAAHA